MSDPMTDRLPPLSPEEKAASDAHWKECRAQADWGRLLAVRVRNACEDVGVPADIQRRYQPHLDACATQLGAAVKRAGQGLPEPEVE
jgi:hypothetical protein